MRQIKFVKLAGCGNDFILVDARQKSFSGNPSTLARAWCDRKRGIGADGLLLALPSRKPRWTKAGVVQRGKAAARMRIFNPDGSEAQMCGNGLRCLVWYLHTRNSRCTEFSVETHAGVMQAQIIWPEGRGAASSSRSRGKERVRLYLSRPKSLRFGQKLKAAGKSYQVHFVNSGVPHAVLLVSHLEKVEMDCLGPVIRHHRLFKPAGTNVNAVRIDSPHRIAIRTYERGVEGETLACGTGAVAAVVIGTALGKLASPVQVKTAGGESLRVGFTQNRKPWEDLYLEGPAQILFKGEISRTSLSNSRHSREGGNLRRKQTLAFARVTTDEMSSQ